MWPHTVQNPDPAFVKLADVGLLAGTAWETSGVSDRLTKRLGLN